MKIRKKIIIRMLSALTVMCTAISMAVFPSYAIDEDINSKGNIVLEDTSGDVAFYAADAGYLQNELDNLYQELPEISYSQYYGTTRKSGLNSKGIIDYANGTVVIDSSDFAYLADEIDSLEAEYKKNTIDALNSMGTFFFEDGSINHEGDESFSEAASELSFEKIYEGIKQSQSVDHLAEQDIAGAIEDNLSKGTAAWVNGELVIGTGADNDAYYQKGIKDVVDNPSNYGISTAPKADYLVTSSGGASYTIETDGEYTFHVITTYHQDGSHHAHSCGSYLTIGDEKITVFHNGWNGTRYESVGNTNYTITRYLEAGTVVKCSVADPFITDIDGGSVIYTVASLTIY